MNLPNKITMSRIFIAFIFMIFVIPFPDWVFQSELLLFIRPQLASINNFLLAYGNYIAAVVFIISQRGRRIVDVCDSTQVRRIAIDQSASTCGNREHISCVACPEMIERTQLLNPKIAQVNAGVASV